MMRKVSACLLLACLLLAAPVHGQTMPGGMVPADVNLSWGTEQLSLGEQLARMDNRHYVSLAGLRQLGFRAEYGGDDGERLVLTHGDERVSARFAPVYYRNRVVVLMYHALADESWGQSVLAEEDFRKQMSLLKEKPFNIIDMQQYIEFILHGEPVPDNAVLLTFDDGYEDFYTHAFPILQELSFPATNFVIVKWIDEPYGLPKLTWEQMREMQQSGMSFYSHTYDAHFHAPVNEAGREGPVLTNRLYLAESDRNETVTEYRARVLRDLTKAEERLREQLDNDWGVLSFPYGAYNEDVLDLAEQAGIAVTFTIEPGINGPGDRIGYRINAGYPDNDGREMVSALQRGLRKGPPSAPELYFGEELLPFAGEHQPLVLDGEVWVPLRELLDNFGMTLRLDRQESVIHIY